MKRFFITTITIILAASSCGPRYFSESDEYPPIFPDYVGVTVPEGMAKLTFEMADGRKFKEKREIKDGIEWVTVSAWKKGDKDGVRYRSFPIYISKDEIDPFIAYRLIEPGYESWKDMGIFQRELASYRESAIVTNEANNGGCVNCHTFQGGSPEKILFHARCEGGGTVFIDGGKVRLLNLATVGPKRQGTYPAWHPDGRYVAFSSNSTKQIFTIDHTQPIEVYDTASDIILMDLQDDMIVVPLNLCEQDKLETFPAWSEDGKTLYYCASDTPEDVVVDRRQMHYKLMAIGFEDGHFIGDPKVIWEDPAGSASFPRERNGKILFTRSDFATFPIWHKEADLWLLDIATGEAAPAEELNSDGTESYHSWSSNGRWVIFSSRRIDDRYTRLFIAHYNGDGTFGKPFLLPQRKPSHNTLRLKSYNIPEFVTGETPSCQKEVAKLFER